MQDTYIGVKDAFHFQKDSKANMRNTEIRELKPALTTFKNIPETSQIHNHNHPQNEIKNNIEQIRENAHLISSLYRSDLNKSNSMKIQSLVDKNDNLVHVTRRKIKALVDYPGDQMVKIAQQKALARKLLECTREYQRIQEKARENYKNQVGRQVKMVNPNATDVDIENVIQGGSLNRVFLSRMSPDTLNDISNRQDEITKIEHSIVELCAIMEELSGMLSHHQNMVDQIEVNVDEGAQYVELGSTQLTKSARNARAARKSKRWICLCIAVLIIVALIAVELHFKLIQNFVKGIK